jgi:hypothetical protein
MRSASASGSCSTSRSVRSIARVHACLVDGAACRLELPLDPIELLAEPGELGLHPSARRTSSACCSMPTIGKSVRGLLGSAGGVVGRTTSVTSRTGRSLFPLPHDSARRPSVGDSPARSGHRARRRGSPSGARATHDRRQGAVDDAGVQRAGYRCRCSRQRPSPGTPASHRWSSSTRKTPSRRRRARSATPARRHPAPFGHLPDRSMMSGADLSRSIAARSGG